MSEPQEHQTSTHQSWTGSVAVFLARPPRAALYSAQHQWGTRGQAAPGTAAHDLSVIESQQSSLPELPHGAWTAGTAAGPPAARLAPPRQQPALLPAPNKAALRGTWLLSRGSATLTAALSAAGKGEFTVKVQLESTTLWLQDLFSGGGEVRLLPPAPPGRQQQQQQVATGGGGGGGRPGSDAAAAHGSEQCWLLLLLPARSTQSDNAAAANDVGAVTVVAAAPLPALCFRFNSPGEGRAFQSLLEAANRVKEAVVRRAEERQREMEQQQQQRRAEGRQQRRKLRGQSRTQRQMVTAAGGSGARSSQPRAAEEVADLGSLLPALAPRTRAGGVRWSDDDIRGAIERYLLDPDFLALVERVEAIWDEMEEQAERQLQPPRGEEAAGRSG